MSQRITHFRQDERGAAMVEYGMLVGLISVICLVAITSIGREISAGFNIIVSALAAI